MHRPPSGVSEAGQGFPALSSGLREIKTNKEAFMTRMERRRFRTARAVKWAAAVVVIVAAGVLLL